MITSIDRHHFNAGRDWGLRQLAKDDSVIAFAAVLVCTLDHIRMNERRPLYTGLGLTVRLSWLDIL